MATRGRLRSSRGLKTLSTGQRFFEGFEAMQALAREQFTLACLARGYSPAGATPQERARAVAGAVTLLGACLRRAARS
jgi:hypothetical protein